MFTRKAGHKSKGAADSLADQRVPSAAVHWLWADQGRHQRLFTMPYPLACSLVTSLLDLTRPLA
jgi:hypothetical protein